MKILENLLKVKSIMTLGILVVFMVLSLEGRIDESLIISVITAVITYYFTKKEV